MKLSVALGAKCASGAPRVRNVVYVIEVQGIRVDPGTRRVWRDGEPVAFSRKEFDLLFALISRAGDVVSREQLMREVWHTSFWTSSKTIDVHLGWVRRKIGDDPRRPHLITTLRGRGLRFEPVDQRGARVADPVLGSDAAIAG